MFFDKRPLPLHSARNGPMPKRVCLSLDYMALVSRLKEDIAITNLLADVEHLPVPVHLSSSYMDLLKGDITITNLSADAKDLLAADSAPDFHSPIEWTPIDTSPLPTTAEYTQELRKRQSFFLAIKNLSRSEAPYSEKDNSQIPSNNIEPSASSNDKAISTSNSEPSFNVTAPERMSVSFIVNPFDLERPTMVRSYP